MALTREEKRARQSVAWDESAARSRYISKKRKAGAFLPGGALNVEAGSGSSSSGGSGLSVRARLAASQSGLIKLNTNKRDMRSIDEITRDLQEKRGGVEVKKVITGAEAEKFGDWFSTKKDKERERERERLEREKRERERQERDRLAAEEAKERERKAREREREKEKERERERARDRSRSGSITAPSQPQPKRSATSTAAAPKPAPIIVATKPSTLLTGGSKLSTAPKEYKVTVKTTGTPITSQPLPTPTSSVPPNRPRIAAPPATSSKLTSTTVAAKRRRSYNSESDSYDSEEEERERNRRRARKSAAGGRGGSGFDIWSIINPGKSRQEYLGRDVVSDDDEDMEATGRDLEKEEKQRCVFGRVVILASWVCHFSWVAANYLSYILVPVLRNWKMLRPKLRSVVGKKPNAVGRRQREVDVHDEPITSITMYGYLYSLVCVYH
jgi:protein SPT2